MPSRQINVFFTFLAPLIFEGLPPSVLAISAPENSATFLPLYLFKGSWQSPAVLPEVEQSPGEHGVGIFEAPWRRTIHRLPHRCGGTQTKGAQSK